MEEGLTVLYVGLLLIKVCLIALSCLFLTFPEGEQAAAHH